MPRSLWHISVTRCSSETVRLVGNPDMIKFLALYFTACCSLWITSATVSRKPISSFASSNLCFGHYTPSPFVQLLTQRARWHWQRWPVSCWSMEAGSVAWPLGAGQKLLRSRCVGEEPSIQYTSRDNTNQVWMFIIAIVFCCCCIFSFSDLISSLSWSSSWDRSMSASPSMERFDSSFDSMMPDRMPQIRQCHQQFGPLLLRFLFRAVKPFVSVYVSAWFQFKRGSINTWQ